MVRVGAGDVLRVERVGAGREVQVRRGRVADRDAGVRVAVPVQSSLVKNLKVTVPVSGKPPEFPIDAVS